MGICQNRLLFHCPYYSIEYAQNQVHNSDKNKHPTLCILRIEQALNFVYNGRQLIEIPTKQITIQKENKTMSKNEIVSLIETMNDYDELASKAKAKADAIRDALKEEMLRLDTEELNAGAYILRYTSIISNRFDSTTFKRLYADLYKDFTKPVSSRRFSVSC